MHGRVQLYIDPTCVSRAWPDWGAVVCCCWIAKCQSRWPQSVLYCTETSKHVLELFSPSGRPTVPVFDTKHYRSILTGIPLTRASNVGGVWKTCNFQPVSRFVSEMIQDRGIILCNINENSYTIYQKLPVPVILISRLWYYSTSDNSKMLQARAIIITANYQDRKSYMTFRLVLLSHLLTLSDNSEFKGTPLFSVEYLGNYARCGHSYNGVLSSLSNCVISNDLEWPLKAMTLFTVK